MKKLLLSLLCIIGMLTASAETYTYTMAEFLGSATNSSLEAWTCGGFTFTPAQNGGSTHPAYNKAGDVRLYATNTLTIKANGASITSVSFAISAAGMKRLTDVTPSVGAIVEQGVNPLVWEGAAPEITFTVGEKSTYGSEGPTKAGQLDFDSVTITTDGAVDETNPGGGEPEPEPELPKIDTLSALIDFEKGEAFEMDTELTVVYVYGGNVYVYDGINYGMIFKYDLGLNAGDVIAKGWTGKVDIYSGLTEMVPDSPLTVSGTTEIPEPYEVDGEMAGIMLMPYNQNVYLKLLAVTFAEATPSGKTNFTGTMTDGEETYEVTFRNNYGMAAVEAGTYDVLAFVGLYNGAVQLYPVEYLGASEPIVPEIPVLETLSAIYDMDNGTEFLMGIDLKVLYSNGAYVYVNDGFQNALIYKKDLGLTAGDVIAKGWKANISIYNNLIEIVPADALTVAETGAILPSPIDVEAEEAGIFVAAYNQAAYLNLRGVTFNEATPTSGSFTGTMGETTINFYQRFGLPSVEPGTYSVVGFVAVYKNDVQVYPISFEYTTGISAISNDNAPVKYYNLQGIEVSNPVQGQLYIRVQGKNATKVIIR